MNLYPESETPDLDPGLFSNPPPHYRGAPFWSWNTAMKPGHLSMLADFKVMGMGGAHIHPRTGLRTPYLGAEYLSLVAEAVREAERQNMLVWLYDEDRWPSGYAGGLITRERTEHRQKILVFTRTPDKDWVPPAGEPKHLDLRRSGAGTLMARYALLRHGNDISGYRRLSSGEAAPAGWESWYAYSDTNTTSRWFNRGAYLDTLSTAAVRAFISATHEVYKQAVGEYFGTTIPAIFTDEPQMAASFSYPETGADFYFPWTGGFAESYMRDFGQDIFDTVPELAFDLPDRAHESARLRYHEHRSQLFSQSYTRTIGTWCERSGIASTGHLMSEDSLRAQACWVGETMRNYPHFHIPGIDMLVDDVEACFATAKQAQSVVRQQGGKAMLSELYGVTGWDFDFTGHKRQGDWQAALGVTVRVHHLSWVSMKGEAKRDYPAPIDRHSPWWREYSLVERHFARLNTALVRGRPICTVAVIHPVESAWMHLSPGTASSRDLKAIEATFFALTCTLLNGLIDFDFVAESLLPGQSPEIVAGGGQGPGLRVGDMVYRTVILPGMHVIHTSTLSILHDFAKAGGRIVVINHPPRRTEAGPTPAWLNSLPVVELRGNDLPAKELPKGARPTADPGAGSLLALLQSDRELRCEGPDGETVGGLVSQMRDDNGKRWVFVTHTDRQADRGICTLSVKGRWTVERWDTISGTSRILSSQYGQGWTAWRWYCPGAAHELVHLLPAPESIAAGDSADPGARRPYADDPHTVVPAYPPHETVLEGPAALSLDEANVLLLDKARWRLTGDMTWQPENEVLRIDNFVRARLGMEAVSGDISQPWFDSPAKETGEVELSYRIFCELPLSGVKLALEDYKGIMLDGKPVTNAPSGFWVDESIALVALPHLAAGEHELVVRCGVRTDSTLEWAYLLGDFGVSLFSDRTKAVLTTAPDSLNPGDWVDQGLPFYAGNVTYAWNWVTAEPGIYFLRLPEFKAPLAVVLVDGRRIGPVAFPPYGIELGETGSGTHRIEILVYGSRVNSFGPMHLADPGYRWLGPSAYRTEGNQWSESWHLKPCGLMQAPRIFRRNTADDRVTGKSS